MVIRARRSAVLLCVLAAAGCGGRTAVEGGGTEETGNEGGEAAEGRAERARLALVDGDLPLAGRLAAQALQLVPTDPAAREVAARVALAEGRDADAVEVLSGATEQRLVRLRARAHARIGDWEAVAADLGSVAESEPADGWAEAVLPLARAASGRTTYELAGAERAALPMDSRAAVPIVEIAVDGRPVHALVATSADLTIVDDDVRATPGVANAIALGAVEVRSVPVLSRDLDPIGDTLGVPIGAVIGTDLMLRLETTIDGRERWVVFRRAGREASESAARVPFVTFEGTFLAVPVVLNAEAEGWFTLDTSGVFPVALGPLAIEALGLDPDRLDPAPNAPSDAIRMTELRTVRFGQVEMEAVPGVTGLVPAELSELAGAPISGILGAAMVHQLKLTLDPSARALFVE